MSETQITASVNGKPALALTKAVRNAMSEKQVTAQPKNSKNKQPAVKYPVGVTQEFVDRVASLGNDGLKALIVELQRGIDDARTFLKTNPDIIREKAQLAMSTGPSNDTIKHLGNRTKFVLDELKKNGQG